MRRAGVAVALILLLDLLFLLIDASSGAPGSASGPVGIGGIWLRLVSPEFLLLTATEIAGLAIIAGRTVDGGVRLLLGAPAALVLLSPTMVGPRSWEPVVTVLASGLLIALFVAILQYLYRTKQLAAPVRRYLVIWSALAAGIAVGSFLWDLDRSPVLLAAAVLGQLGGALYAAFVAPPRNEGERPPWLLRPFAIFQLLLFIFLAEFFLGARLDLAIAGPGFLRYIPTESIGGSSVAAVGAGLYDGLWFAAAVFASAWFLVVLGFTMGPLVLLKARETRERPQRYRLWLTVAVYALAAVYIPSFASSTPLVSIPALARLPVIGWGFGLRAGGPFEASISLAVLLMYAGVGVLTVLFGRKALCAVMCGAALMYQGTAIHEMRRYNQTSKVGRYFLGGQLSTAYVVMSGVALLSLFAVSLLALLHMLPAVQVANGEFDTAALPLPIELYFGGLWFAMFVSTPYIGTYNCATTGFCHWGALSLPFAKVGLFRLKVRDRTICQTCTTFDCAQSCPVGLVEMPFHFRTKGEYRSTKCCGVGDCVGACPYGNLYHEDVRSWLRRAVGRPDPWVRPPGTPLPMVPVARRPVGSGGAGADPIPSTALSEQ